MKTLGPILILSTIAGSASASIMPKNNLQIPVGQKTRGGLTETQYHDVINKIEKVYAPIVRSQGGNLVILRKWESGTVNAGTYREETNNNWYVNLYGGYARHPEITEDGFALVVCHEIGHHIGGAPKKDPSYGHPDWSSTEGQADYFATLKCLRKIFAKDNNSDIVDGMYVPYRVRSKCKESFEAAWESALCMRTTMAGQSVANVAATTLNAPRPSLETDDFNVVTETLNQHPTAQCRLDTYFRGSICQVSSYRPVSQYDPKVGACDLTNGYTVGTRPLCWYKP